MKLVIFEKRNYHFHFFVIGMIGVGVVTNWNLAALAFTWLAAMEVRFEDSTPKEPKNGQVEKS